MSQIVKSEVIESCIRASSVEPMLHVSQIHASLPVSEHKRFILTLALKVKQNAPDLAIHGNVPVAACLCIGHVNYASLKVNVPPRQTQELASPLLLELLNQQRRYLIEGPSGKKIANDFCVKLVIATRSLVRS